jgi:GNAT superfamily N-acetyltransferase
MSDFVVRKAGIADALAIAEVHVLAWQQTYRHLVDSEELDALDPAVRAVRWCEILSSHDEDAWVAVMAGKVVAWITTSVRDPERHPRDRELNGIYALAGVHGSGVGQALLDTALGDAPAFLWTAAHNPRAHAFYLRNGFVADGSRDVHPLLGTPVDIVRLVR